MKIVLVSYPFAAVGNQTAGGAEQVLGILERGLFARGHNTVVIAAEGSRVVSRLVAIRAAEPSDSNARESTWLRMRTTVDRAIVEVGPNVVHYHGVDFPAYLSQSHVPALATLHLSAQSYFEDVFNLKCPRTWLNCVSNTQRRGCPNSPRLLDTVANGIELQRWTFSAQNAGYAVWMGRICPEKGVHNALIAAKRAGKRLFVCGQVFPYVEHVEYFEREVVPRLDSDRVFLGPLDIAARSALLGQAECLLVPTEAEETSCLSAMEAMACGTPVVALRRGAVPEVVEHGRSGLIVDAAPGLADAISHVGKIDRFECRSVAESRFDSRDMVNNYERLYLKLSPSLVEAAGVEERSRTVRRERVGP